MLRGIPLLKNKKGFLVVGFWFLGVLSSWFQKCFMFSKDIRHILPKFHFMLLIDMKFISKLLEIIFMEKTWPKALITFRFSYVRDRNRTFPWFLDVSLGNFCLGSPMSSLVSPKLTRPTLFYVHCVSQEGGRMQGWESKC